MKQNSESYPSTSDHREVQYVNILDGVAGYMHFSGHLSKGIDDGEHLTVEVGGLLYEGSPSPYKIRIVGGAPGSATLHTLDTVDPPNWAPGVLSATCNYSVKTSNCDVVAQYSGAALPNMPNNVSPVGFLLTEHPYTVEAGYGGDAPPHRGGCIYDGPEVLRYHLLLFVAYFKAIPASWTNLATYSPGGEDLTMDVAFEKCLNYNQAPTALCTTTMFGNTPTTLATSWRKNTYGQITGVGITLPFKTMTPKSYGAHNVHLKLTESADILSASNYTNTSIPHCDMDMAITVNSGADTTMPEILECRFLSPTDPLLPNGFAGRMLFAPSILDNGANRDCFGGAAIVMVKAKDTGQGLASMDLSVALRTPDNSVDQTYTLSHQITGPDAAPNAIFTAFFTLLTRDYLSEVGGDGVVNYRAYATPTIRVRDKSLNVNTRGVDPVTPNTPFDVYFGGCPVVGIYPNSIWTTISAVVRAPGFVEKVEIYLNNVLKDTKTTHASYGSGGTFDGVFTGLCAIGYGTFTVKIIVYDKSTKNPLTGADERHTTTYSESITHSSGGGCVDPEALISMGDGTAKPAWLVQVGDSILVRDPYTGGLSTKPIGEVKRMGFQPCLRLTMEDGGVHVCSETHRIYVEEQGYYRAKDLRSGCTVLSPNGRRTIKSLEPIEPREVITYSVNDSVAKNYFADGVLAHNEKPLDCVLPGTLCLMLDRTYRVIEDLSSGDKILSYNVQDQVFEEDTVGDIFITRTDSLNKVVLANKKTLVCTDSHTFLTHSQAWTQVSEIKKLPSLPHILMEDGSFAEIVDVEPQKVDPDTKVYIFSTLKLHNMVLGGIVCHNKIEHPEPLIT